jgi:hypothetical protein
MRDHWRRNDFPFCIFTVSNIIQLSTYKKSIIITKLFVFLSDGCDCLCRRNNSLGLWLRKWKMSQLLKQKNSDKMSKIIFDVNTQTWPFVLVPRHFVNLKFYQLTILLLSHLFNSQFHQLAILPTWPFLNMLLCHGTICSTFNFINLQIFQLAVSSTCCLVNLHFFLPDIASNFYFGSLTFRQGVRITILKCK